MRTAVVVGAGIGGVAAAVALQQVGWRVILLERASTIGEVGAGLSIWPSAVAELDRLGVRGLAQDAAPAIFGMRLADGRWVFQATNLGVKSPVMIHRAQLHDRITDQFGPNITIRTAFTVTGVDPDATGATVRGDGEELRADLVVAADGISSTVRGVLHPRHKGPVYAGYTSYRGLADVETGYVGGETWGRGRRFGFARLIDGRVYWYATGNQPAHRRDELSDVRAAFGDWHSPIPDILAATTHLLQHDVYDLALPLPPFAAGHVALLGPRRLFSDRGRRGAAEAPRLRELGDRGAGGLRRGAATGHHATGSHLPPRRAVGPGAGSGGRRPPRRGARGCRHGLRPPPLEGRSEHQGPGR